MSLKTIITYKKVEKILRKQFKGKLTLDCHIMTCDDKYYCPSIAEVNKILLENPDLNWYSDSTYDCDDFARQLQAAVSQYAYFKGVRKNPYCIGRIHGDITSDTPHAINLFIDNNLQVFFIEPQSGRIIIPNDTDIEISFIEF